MGNVGRRQYQRQHDERDSDGHVGRHLFSDGDEYRQRLYGNVKRIGYIDNYATLGRRGSRPRIDLYDHEPCHRHVGSIGQYLCLVSFYGFECYKYRATYGIGTQYLYGDCDEYSIGLYFERCGSS